MDLDKYPPDVQKFISGLIETNAIGDGSTIDLTFINYLYGQRYDEDYIEVIKSDLQENNIK